MGHRKAGRKTRKKKPGIIQRIQKGEGGISQRGSGRVRRTGDRGTSARRNINQRAAPASRQGVASGANQNFTPVGQNFTAGQPSQGLSLERIQGALTPASFEKTEFQRLTRTPEGRKEVEKFANIASIFAPIPTGAKIRAGGRVAKGITKIA